MEDKSKLAEQVHRNMNKIAMLGAILRQVEPGADFKVENPITLGLGYLLEDVEHVLCEVIEVFREEGCEI